MTAPRDDGGKDSGARRGTAGRADAFAWRFVSPLYMGAALNPINSSLIATALVPIAHSLDVPVGRTAVLVAALYLASAVAQPTAGKLSEEFGPRRVFVTGVLVVLLGGIVGGLAQNLTTLIVARVLIGIGTSAGYPSAMLMIRRRATWAGMEAPPGGVLGGLSIAGTVTAAVGPPIGGLLIGAFGWRSAFFINIPFALATLAMALLWIPRDTAWVRRSPREVAARIDVVGIVGFGGSLCALLVFLLGLPEANWTALVVAAVIGAALVRWELRVPTPFFDVRQLVRNMALSRTYIRTALTLLGVYTVLYGVTQWLQEGRGYSAEAAGLLILPMGAVAAVVTRPVSSRNLVRGPLVVGVLCMLAASTGLLFLTSHSPVVLILAVTLIFGLTLGATNSANQTALYSQAPPDQVGTASGLFRTFVYFGSIGSSTLTGIVFKNHVTDGGLHTIALILMGVSVVVLLMTLADRQLRSPSASSALEPKDAPPIHGE
jgi:MFS family permease